MTAPEVAAPPLRAAIVGHVAVRDADKWARYVAAVPATLAPWHGEIAMRGEQRLALNGMQHGTHVVVIRFPDVAAIDAWYRSAPYQALIPLRDEAADVVLSAYQT